MNFSKEQIQEYILMNMKGANFEEDSHFSKALKMKLVEAKVLVDRWNLVSTDIIVHSSLKEFFRTNLGDSLTKGIDKSTTMTLGDLFDNLGTLFKILPKMKDAEFSSLKDVMPLPKVVDIDCDYIWGATIHYSDDMPKDKGIMMALNGNKFQDARDPDRCVAVFPM